MKKFKFTINKKIIYYIIACFLLYTIKSCVIEAHYHIPILYMVLFLANLRLIIYHVEFDDESIVTGLLFGKIMHYRNIGKVIIDDKDLIIYSKKGLSDNIKISLAQLNYNIDKSREFLTEIYDRTNKDKSILCLELKEFIKGERKNLYTKRYEYLILMVQFLIICLLFKDAIVTFNDIKYLLYANTIDTTAILISTRIILTLIIVIFAIYTLKLFGKYNENAPRVMKEYRWAYVVYKVLAVVIELVVNALQKNAIRPFDIFNSALSIAMSLLITLLIIEYLNTSKMVRFCFGDEV